MTLLCALSAAQLIMGFFVFVFPFQPKTSAVPTQHKSTKKEKRRRTVASQTRNREFYAHHICERSMNYTEADDTKETIIRPEADSNRVTGSPIRMFGWLPSPFRLMFQMPSLSSKDLVGRRLYNRWNWSLWAKDIWLKLKSCGICVLRPILPSTWEVIFHVMFFVLSTLCIFIASSVLTDHGLIVQVAICLLVAAFVRFIELWYLNRRPECGNQKADGIDITLSQHRNILENQRRVIARKTLTFLASNKLFIRLNKA